MFIWCLRCMRHNIRTTPLVNSYFLNTKTSFQLSKTSHLVYLLNSIRSLLTFIVNIHPHCVTACVAPHSTMIPAFYLNLASLLTVSLKLQPSVLPCQAFPPCFTFWRAMYLKQHVIVRTERAMVLNYRGAREN